MRNFYFFEWALGFVGSADVQFCLSVAYDDLAFQEEMGRIRSLADGKIMYDVELFAYEAYIY